MNTDFFAVLEDWRSNGTQLLPPNPELVGRLRGELPDSLLNLYSFTGGMKDGDCDAHLFCLWNLESVLSKHIPGTDEYVFADIGLEISTISLINNNIYIKRKWENKLDLIANSIGAFFTLYRNNMIYDIPRS